MVKIRIQQWPENVRIDLSLYPCIIEGALQPPPDDKTRTCHASRYMGGEKGGGWLVLVRTPSFSSLPWYRNHTCELAGAGNRILTAPPGRGHQAARGWHLRAEIFSLETLGRREMPGETDSFVEVDLPKKWGSVPRHSHH